MTKISFFLVVLHVFSCGFVSAADNFWSGDGDRSSWNDEANWSLGLPYYSGDTTPDFQPPANESRAFLGRSFPNSTTVYVNGETYGGAVWLAYLATSGTSHELILEDDAYFYIRRMYIDSNGTLTVNGGDFYLENLNFMNTCTVNMNGGVIDCRGDFWRIGGTVYLNNGTFRIHNGDSFSYYSATLDDYNSAFTGTIDFCGGELVMDGDCRTALQWHMTHGDMIAYGGSGTVVLEYNSVSDTTTARAYAEHVGLVGPVYSAVAEFESPGTLTLDWQAGPDAPAGSGYRLYFGTDAGSLSQIASFGNDETQYTISGLALNQSYYWRVDSIRADNSNIITGKVWSFLTELDPPEARTQILWPQKNMTLKVDSEKQFHLNWKAGPAANEYAGGNVVGYNVYLSTDPASLVQIAADYANTNWQVDNVTLGETYYWRVDEVLDNGLDVLTGEVCAVTVDSSYVDLSPISFEGVTKVPEYTWIGCGDGISWDDAYNWHSEVAGSPLPVYATSDGTGDFTVFPCDYHVDIQIDSDANAEKMFAGTADARGLYRWTVNSGGYMTLFLYYSDANRVLNIKPDGTVNTLVLYLTDGVVNVEGYLGVSSQYWYLKDNSQLKIFNGGQVGLGALPASALGSDVLHSGCIDIYDGELRIYGDQLSTVESWISSGYIIPYGGAINSSLFSFYDVDTNRTYVRAVQDATRAYSPIPTAKTVGFGINDELSWLVAKESTEDTLLVGVKLQADLNRDRCVNTNDLEILSEYWLEDSAEASEQSDIVADHKINLCDLAVIASQWGQCMTLNEVASFPNVIPDERFSTAATLDYDTSYLWQVNSNNGSEVADGHVWSFTTAADPMLAYNEFPGNGENYMDSMSLQLSWDVDSLIDSCHVYFGQVYDVVLDAETSDAAYKTNTVTGTWQTPTLTQGQRYYWRVDTVEGATVRKGKVWSFTFFARPDYVPASDEPWLVINEQEPPTQMLQEIPIDTVWAGHPVFFSLVTEPPYQYAAYYNGDRRMVVAQRNLSDSTFETFVLPPEGTTLGWDSHNYIRMAVDSAGYIHLSGNMHASPLVYFRSQVPYDITTMVRIPSMVGTLENVVTYPEFMYANGQLVFSYRYGVSGSGNDYYNIYDVSTQTWSRLSEEPFIDGEGLMNAYTDGTPKPGPDGWYYTTWVWRDTGDAATNHDPSVIKSPDMQNWYSLFGNLLDSPVTIDTPNIIIDPVPVNGGLLNGRCKMGFTSRDLPVVVYQKYDEDGYTNLYAWHLNSDGTSGFITKLTNWKYRWDLSGGGSLVSELRIGAISKRPDGRMEMSFEHAKYGTGTWLLDYKSETSNEIYIKGIVLKPDLAPGAASTLLSDFPGMLLKYQDDFGDSGDSNVVYRLKWETLDANKDQPRPEPWPDPSQLFLYEVGLPD